MIGPTIARRLEAHGDVKVLGRSSAEIDLTNRDATVDSATDAKPGVVVAAAAKVDGILGTVTVRSSS